MTPDTTPETAAMTPERRYAEEAGVTLASLGLPPLYGKLLAWMLICDPPYQSSSQLVEGLDISKGSVSTGMRMLVGSGMVRRVPAPGRRGHVYEMAPDALASTVDTGVKFRLMREVMEQGLAIIGDEHAPRAQRLRRTRDFYAFVEREIPRLVDRFRREQDHTRHHPSESNESRDDD